MKPKSAKNSESEPRQSVNAEQQVVDPFDPRRLRLSQDFGASLESAKQVTSVPVRKPNRQEWIQVHPDEGYRVNTYLFESNDTRETYLVDPGLWSDLVGEITPKTIFTVVNRSGGLFLWPVRLAESADMTNPWNESALAAAQAGMGQWVRVASNIHVGAYDVFHAPAQMPDPVWPKATFHELLKLGFRDRFIASADHPVLRKLRGEI